MALPGWGGVAPGQHGLDDDDAGAGGHRRAAVAQDAQAALVRPVVQDVLEDVDVAALRHLGEEVARLGAPPAPHRFLAAQDVRADRGRLVEEHPREAGAPAQDREEQAAAPAADVHDPAVLGEGVRPRDHRVDPRRERRHPGVEHLPQLRVPGQVREERLAEQPLEGGARLAHRLLKGGRGPLERRVGQHQDRRVLGVRHVRAQGLAGRSQVEGPRPVLAEDAARGEVAQDAPQVPGVGAGRPCQFARGARARRQVVGHAAARGGAQGRGEEVAERVLDELTGDVLGLGCVHRGCPPYVAGAGRGTTVPAEGRSVQRCGGDA